MEKSKMIELRKKLVALAATGTIGLTAITGCGAKTNTTSTTNKTTLPTVTTTVEETKETEVSEVSKDTATKDYMKHAKEVAKAMYEGNKEYFDEKQYTIEDLENVYYVLNDKYYNEDGQLIMDKVQVDRASDVMRELASPQRVLEMLQKLEDLENKKISLEEYKKEVEKSKFYNYQISLANFIEVNEKNKDVREFFNEYSKMENKVTLNLINGVSPEEILKENIIEMRKAQTGNISDNSVYKNLNNYLGNNTTASDGQAFMVAAMCKATADQTNQVTEGYFITVPVSKDGKETEKIRIGYSYNEQILVNAYYLGELTNTKDILIAKKLVLEEYQTMYFDTMCYRQEKVNNKYFSETKNYTK